MKRYNKIVRRISQALNVVAGIGLVSVVALLTINAITRRISFIGPILGTYEFAGYLTGVAMGFTLALNQLNKENIEVEVLVDHLSVRTQAIISCVVYLVGTVFYIVVSWGVINYGGGLVFSSERSATLHLIYYPWIFALGLCFIMLVMVLIGDFMRAVQTAITGKRVSEEVS